MTRIFNVQFEYQETFDGECDDTVFKDEINVVATEGADAITKAIAELFVPHTLDVEGKEPGETDTINVAYKNIGVLGVTLLAEA